MGKSAKPMGPTRARISVKCSAYAVSPAKKTASAVVSNAYPPKTRVVVGRTPGGVVLCGRERALGPGESAQQRRKQQDPKT